MRLGKDSREGFQLTTTEYVFDRLLTAFIQLVESAYSVCLRPPFSAR